MSTPVRIAVIGNSFASRIQLPALREVGGNEVIGLAGHDREKARRIAREWGIAFATDDWQSLLQLEPDLVIITTPVDLHHEMVLETCRHSEAAILCEKPFAMNAAQAQEMVDAAKGRLALLDHQLRWNPVRRRLRYLLHSGAIGRIWHADFEVQLSSRRYLTNPWRWWYDAGRGGGVLGAIGSHMIDMIRWELGEVAEVCGELHTFLEERPAAEGVWHPVSADEYAAFWLRMESGVRVNARTALCVPGGNGFFSDYTGHKGGIRIENEEELFVAQHGGAPQRVDATLPTAESMNMPDAGPFARSLPLYLADVLEAVRTRSTVLPGAATFDDGLATQRVLDAVRKSALDGGWVSVGG